MLFLWCNPRTPETPRKHPGNTPETPRKHPGNTPEYTIYSQLSEFLRIFYVFWWWKLQITPRKHPGNTPETPQKHPGNTPEYKVFGLHQANLSFFGACDIHTTLAFGRVSVQHLQKYRARERTDHFFKKNRSGELERPFSSRFLSLSSGPTTRTLSIP
jgi:hypothetical protein